MQQANSHQFRISEIPKMRQKNLDQIFLNFSLCK